MEDVSGRSVTRKGLLRDSDLMIPFLFACAIILIPTVAVVSVVGPGLVEEKALIVFPLILLIALMVVGLLMASDPLKLIGNSALILWPVIGHSVPPKRFTISVFDVLGTVAIVAFLLTLRSKKRPRLTNPEWWVTLPVFAILPTVMLGIDWRHSLYVWFEIFAAYCLLAALLHACDDVRDWNERAMFWAAAALSLVAAGVVFERFTQINLSLADANLNADAESGIYRAAGFFQDPQKAAQFVGCLFTFFIVLLVRRAVGGSKMQAMLAFSSLLALVALFMTVSRLSLVSAIALSAASVILVNRFSVLFKTFLFGGTIILMWVFISSPNEVLSLLPDSIAYRLSEISHSSKVRMDIWADSWRFFVNDPIGGLGPGNYQEALMREHLSLRMQHEMGKYVPDQPESGYLKILVETGFFGVFAVLIFLFGVIRAFWRGFASEPGRSFVLASGFSLLAFSASFSTLFTVKDERDLMLMLFLIAVLHRNGIARTAPAMKGASCLKP